MRLEKLPDEIPAVGAECGLTQKCSHEFVPIDLMDSPAHGTTPAIQSLAFLEFSGLLCTTRTGL